MLSYCSEARSVAVGASMISTQQKPQISERPTLEQVRTQLDLVLASSELQHRGAALLKFVVEETLAGRSDYLKAYTLATAVFGRGASFDPQNDPLVRFEAGVLRRSLERYYLLHGRGDEVEITIPKGGYRPAFSLRAGLHAAPPVATETEGQVEGDIAPADATAGTISSSITGWGSLEKRGRTIALAAGTVFAVAVIMAGMFAQSSSVSEEAKHIQKPTVLVAAQFADSVSETKAASSSTLDFRDELILHLVSRGNLTVRVVDVAGIQEAQYVLSGIVRKDGRTYRLSARLTRQSDSAVIWAGSLDSSDGDLRAAAENAAFDFTRRISERLGRANAQ